MSNAPQKIRPGKELEIISINVQVELWSPGVGHMEAEGEEFMILAHLEHRRYHYEYESDKSLDDVCSGYFL